MLMSAERDIQMCSAGQRRARYLRHPLSIQLIPSIRISKLVGSMCRVELVQIFGVQLTWSGRVHFIVVFRGCCCVRMSFVIVVFRSCCCARASSALEDIEAARKQ